MGFQRRHWLPRPRLLKSGSNSWSQCWNCPRSVCRIATGRLWSGRRKRGTEYPSKNHPIKFPLFFFPRCFVRLPPFLLGLVRRLPPLHPSFAARLLHPRLAPVRLLRLLPYSNHPPYHDRVIFACQNCAPYGRTGISPQPPTLWWNHRTTACRAAACARTPTVFCLWLSISRCWYCPWVPCAPQLCAPWRPCSQNAIAILMREGAIYSSIIAFPGGFYFVY